MKTPAPIIFALDFPSLEAARSMAVRLREAVGMIKVGLELFIEAGPAAIALGEEVGLPVFLDLKLHDIPETVERAVGRAAQLGVQILTVHASGGPAMLERAVARAEREGTGLQVTAVTVLTSLDRDDLAAVGVHREVAAQVQMLGTMAYAQGIRSFVCSPHEIETLRGALPTDAVLITPGVRQAGIAATDDQKRVMSAGEAVRRGANWVVVGRPIRNAADPAGAARAIAREIAEARMETDRS